MTVLLAKPVVCESFSFSGSDPLVNRFVEHVEDAVSFAPDIENVVDAVATITLRYDNGTITHSQTVIQPIDGDDCVVTKSIRMDTESDTLFDRLTKDRLDLSEIDTDNNVYTVQWGTDLITLLYDEPNV